MCMLSRAVYCALIYFAGARRLLATSDGAVLT